MNEELMVVVATENGRLKAALDLLRRLCEEDMRKTGTTRPALVKEELNTVLMTAGMELVGMQEEKDPTEEQ